MEEKRYMIFGREEGSPTITSCIDEFRGRNPYDGCEVIVYELRPVKRIRFSVKQSVTVEDVGESL